MVLILTTAGGSPQEDDSTGLKNKSFQDSPPHPDFVKRLIKSESFKDALRKALGE
jgi:hypothetical protein